MTVALDNQELRRRRREKFTVVALFIVLAVFTAIEVQLLRTSAKLPFVNSIFFFGLMNLNIVLIMLLLFLVFRNAVKLILDERRGKAGSRLKTRLVFCFCLFAIIPTVLLFTISAFYIKNSFDKWFSVKVGGTLQRSIEVVKNYYQNTESNAAHFVRKVGQRLTLTSDPRRLTPTAIQKKLEELRMEYGLDGLELYSDPFGGRIVAARPDRLESIPPATLERLKKAFEGVNDCRVQNDGQGELIRCSLFLGSGRGVVLASYFIPLGLASQLSEITLTYEDYKSDNPLNYPIKSTYFAILSMVTLLILFSASWTGFYVAKRLTVPIEELLKGTSEVAQGNLDYVISTGGSDEMAKLIESFNQMTSDLRRNKREIEESHASLEHRRRYIEFLLESVQSGVISLDEAGCITMLNPAALKLLKITSPDWLGKPYREVLEESHRNEFDELMGAVHASSKPIRRELRIRTRDEEWVSLLITLSVLRDEERQPMGVVAVLDDVTDIQKMERMIAWREVAKRIAHEIKNPLTPIQLSVQRLRRRYLDKISDDGTFGESTDIILKEVEAIKTLVNEFSAFARLPEISAVPDSLNEITLEALNLFRAAHERMVFRVELAENLPLMELDRAQLKRVLINLFDNAVAAMDGTGTITVTTELAKAHGVFRLTVADEGCGIEEGVYSQIFEPYFSTKASGTGLGLAIVQKIVADHGGFVRVAANSPRGMRFSIELPESLAVDQRRRQVSLGLAETEPGFKRPNGDSAEEVT